MSEVNPALVIEGGSHDSHLLRQLWGDTYTAGIVAADHLEVTEQSTPALGVTVAAGRAFVEGDEASDQGVYYVSNDAAHDVALATADATNDRIDLIVARILDSFYSGASDEWELQAVTGTPAASPSAPSAPSNSLILAEVTVPADAGGNPAITDAEITDQRSPVWPAPQFHRTPSQKWVRGSTQGIPNETDTIVAAPTGSGSYDDEHPHLDLWSMSSGTLTIQRAGRYRLTAGASWASSGTGYRRVFIPLNGSGANGVSSRQNAVQSSENTVSGVFDVVAGDTFSLSVRQNSGGALNVGGDARTFLAIEALSVD